MTVREIKDCMSEYYRCDKDRITQGLTILQKYEVITISNKVITW